MLSRLKDWLCSLWERHLLKPVDSFRENKQIEQTLEMRGVIDVTSAHGMRGSKHRLPMLILPLTHSGGKRM